MKDIGEGSGDGRTKAQAAARAGGPTILAASIPHMKCARRVDAALSGIEAKHHFAKAQTIPAALRIGEYDRVHKSLPDDSLPE
jgi:hypothetical protein